MTEPREQATPPAYISPPEMQANTQKLRDLLSAATPTPWEWFEGTHHGSAWSGGRRGTLVFDDGSAGGEYRPACSYRNSELIIAAVNALPSLLQRIEELEAAAREVVELLDAPEDCNCGDFHGVDMVCPVCNLRLVLGPAPSKEGK